MQNNNNNNNNNNNDNESESAYREEHNRSHLKCRFLKHCSPGRCPGARTPRSRSGALGHSMASLGSIFLGNKQEPKIAGGTTLVTPVVITARVSSQRGAERRKEHCTDKEDRDAFSNKVFPCTRNLRVTGMTKFWKKSVSTRSIGLYIVKCKVKKP